MAVLDEQATGPRGLTETEYLNWNPYDSPISVHMHLDAVDGIAHDVAEGFESLPRRGLEVGGLLLGRVETGEKPTVWIERYQRIPCEHKFGPQFLLDDADKAGLEKAASAILAGGELAVVGLYRSHTRDGFHLDPPDFDLIRSYFSDVSDLILLIKPEGPTDIVARFYVHDSNAGARGAGEPFPFRGHLVGRDTLIPELVPGVMGAAPEEKKDAPPRPEPAARGQVREMPSQAAPEPAAGRERPRRLIPDFVPSPVEPSQAPPPAESPAPPFLFPPRDRILEEEEPPSLAKRVLKWVPAIAVLLLAGGGLWWALQPGSHLPQVSSSAPAEPNEPARPLGLAVEPMGQTWRVSWNPNATALHDARSVQLFVREGDEQNRIDLSRDDLAAGVYKYQPAGNDVTFRLEVMDNSGRISAESFRLERAATTVTTPAPKASAPPPPPQEPAVIHRTEPKAIHRAPPVIAAGIRPRITGTIPVDVKVHIDEHGRVTSAAPVVKAHGGLDAYLSQSAVQAAKLWRFEPARENGKPVPGTQTIHFVFQK